MWQISGHAVSVLNSCTSWLWGMRWRSWLSYCATSRKVAGSIPDRFNGSFLPKGKGDRCLELTITFTCGLSRNSGSLSHLEPSWACAGMYRNGFDFHPEYNLEACVCLPHVDHIHCKGMFLERKYTWHHPAHLLFCINWRHNTLLTVCTSISSLVIWWNSILKPEVV
jgi:hypothetical protein